MTLLLTSVICIIAVELFLKAPLGVNISALSTNIKKTNHVILSSKISDHWKEKVLLSYSKNIAAASIKLLIISVTIFLILLLIINALELVIGAEPSILAYISSTEGIILSTIIAIIYYYGRKKFLK